MSNRLTIVNDFVGAVRARDEEKLKSLAGHLSDDVVVGSPMGSATGKDKILSRFGASGGGGPAAAMMGQVTWGEAELTGDKVSVSATLPPGLPLPIPIKGLTMVFTFTDADLIARIDITPQM